MKTLYLIHEFYPAHHGGTEKFILQLAQRAQAEGHEVKIITYDKQNREPMPTLIPLTSWRQQGKKLLAALGRRIGPLPKSVTLNHEPIQYYEEIYGGVPVLGFRAAQLDQTQFHLTDSNLTVFAEVLLHREAPDIIHAGYLLRTAEFLYAAQRLGIPYLITLTTFWLICPKHILINEKQHICEGPRGGTECLIACPSFSHGGIKSRYVDMQRLLNQAEAVVVPSQYLARIFQNEISNLALTHIPYGIDRQYLPPNRRVYPTGQPLVFFFGGRLVHEKGIDLLLTAFQRLPSQQICLHIYGDGRLRPIVQRAALRDNRITYGGVYTPEQVGDLLHQVDVLLVPSLWPENLPLIMQEAQAAGVPTLVSDVGGMTECVTDGVNGFTFRVGDVDDLQVKMQMIIDQPQMLNAIKENICNPSPGQYQVTSLEQEAALYLEQYTRILAKSEQVSP